MTQQVVFLFGEAERGELCLPMLCKTLVQMEALLGSPPEGSRGLCYGVQALLFERDLVFYRVQEEGFSHDDYLKGAQFLQGRHCKVRPSAICLPGVGDENLIQTFATICHEQKSILIIEDKDLYDYLSQR